MCRAASWFFLFLLISCKTIFVPASVEYDGYRVNVAKVDSSLVSLMMPYHDSIHKVMNANLGTAVKTLHKKQPEGTLGNFMVDAMLHMARQKFGVPVDVAVMNYGGIRLPELQKGPVSRSRIFELMPFDNLLVIQKLNGKALQQFFDLIAEHGGWPIAGATMQIRDKKAVNVLIGGEPLQDLRMYTVANSNYIAEGGDDAYMLKNTPYVNINYLIRDAIIDYIRQKGNLIDAQLENRIRNAQ